MAFADLGVRIILEDGASAGLNALSLSMLNMFTRGGLLASVWSKLPPQIQAAGIMAGASGLLFGGLSDFLKQCIDAAGQLQQEMANLDVSVNGASDAGSALTDTLINIADHSIYTTATIADGFTALGVDGWNATALIGGMGDAMKNFAEASRTDVVPAANLLGTTMETYGAQASQATQYTNDLTFALYNGQKTVANMQAAFNQAGATAAGLKVPFGELMDTFALLGEDGLKGTQAGSALRYMLTSLSDPTNKAAKELAALGITTISTTSPAFIQLRNNLEGAGGAAAKSANQFDGTVTSLLAMFTQAQKVGAVHTDESFYQWATAAGILSDKLYDAKGNFIGIQGSIDVLGQSIDKMNPEQKAQAIQQLFNVRGAQAARLLLQDYQSTLSKFDKLDGIRQATSATQKAADVTNTLQGNAARLKSTWTDTMARLGSVDLGPIGQLAGSISDLLHNFNTAPQKTRDFAGQLLVASTAAAGLTFVVSLVVFIIGAFGGAIASILGPVAIALGVIAGLVALFFTLKAAIEGNKQVADIFHTVMGVLGGLIKNLGEQFQNLMKSMKLLEPVWNILKVVLVVVAVIIGGVIVLAIGILIAVFIALAFTVNLLIQVFSRVFSFIGTLIGNTVAGIKAAPQIFANAWHTIQNIGTAVWGTIVKSITGFLTSTKNAITGGFDTIKQKIQDAINFIVGLFNWLVAHNYWFAQLVANIKAQIAKIQLEFTVIKNWLTTLWTNLWTLVSGKVSEAWANITGQVDRGKTDATNKFNAIKLVVTSLWTNLWSQVTGKVQDAWNRVTGLFDVAKNMVSGKANDIKNSVLTPIQNLGQMLFNFGQNALQQFINGIQSKIAALGNVLGAVGNKVKGILGFHSPPKEGPLADSDTYMPNMMKMFGSGIDAHTGVVVGSAQKAARAIGSSLGAINPASGIGSVGSVMTSAMTRSIQSGATNGGMNQTLTIPLVVDGQTLSTVVVKQIGSQLTVNGLGRALR